MMMNFMFRMGRLMFEWMGKIDVYGDAESVGGAVVGRRLVEKGRGGWWQEGWGEKEQRWGREAEAREGR